DAVLLPPVLGTRPGSAIYHAVCDAAGCPVLEMAGLPPGVTGMRLSRLFYEALRREGVCLCENTRVLASDRQGRRVTGLFTSHEDGVRRFEADRFVLATGGVLGGGIVLEPGRGRAPVLGLSFPVPEETAEWTRKDVFAPQPFAMLGVPVT
ncbi:MAG: anaerobic glycerol-3-phosphate dehydrogenase subunit B, partial [Desulfovibrio sp.]|nr:anaerobic glycerol-3-phosphate dehydrogenase subunit B [Desulfovibrio sp.]